MIHKIIANSVINELFFNMFEKQVLKIQIRFFTSRPTRTSS